ncbi:Hsp70 family protein [Frigidibacter oleivorans]|uniref:Hsp70 family protein n=1 Tax=Frigidibacter oleivorans TaxID=2487129 RepID=UPI000F8EF55D|nr:Hsp70 family protein [Frigidibacter oleivorans]
MYFGIDLGTTNSLISVFENGRPRVLGGSQPLFPSVVSVMDGTLVLGAPARERLVSHPEHTAAAFKRAMGTKKAFRLGWKQYDAQELSALILRALRQRALEETGVAPQDVVVSVPAYFNQIQRNATRAAAIAAGLNPIRLVNEPTAAAIAYGLQDIAAEGHTLVVDLGGGTFDVSIVEVFEKVIEVKASSGDAFLGGEDFTRALFNRLAQEFDLAPKTDAERALLWNAAEVLKLGLTRAQEASCPLPWRDGARALSITREAFTDASASLIQRLRLPIERAIHDAGLSRDEIDRVVLVGGATRMPLVRTLVARLTGKLPESGLDPDQVVALGAATQAALIARDAGCDDVVMTDVSAFSLGFEVARRVGDRIEQGYFEPVIERNTTIPVSREFVFQTTQKGQREILFELFQGEAPLVRDNIALGKLLVAVPRNRADYEIVIARLSYDSSGLIEIDTKVASTGATRSIVITDLTGGLSERELDARRKTLAALKVHPREGAENVALSARLERCFAMALGEDRVTIQDMLALFRQALERQHLSEIAALREQIGQTLDQFEAGYVR